MKDKILVWLASLCIQLLKIDSVRTFFVTQVLRKVNLDDIVVAMKARESTVRVRKNTATASGEYKDTSLDFICETVKRDLKAEPNIQIRINRKTWTDGVSVLEAEYIAYVDQPFEPEPKHIQERF